MVVARRLYLARHLFTLSVLFPRAAIRNKIGFISDDASDLKRETHFPKQYNDANNLALDRWMSFSLLDCKVYIITENMMMLFGCVASFLVI